MDSTNSAFARIVSRELRKYGHSDEEVFRGTGISEADLWAITEIPLEPFIRLLENAERLKPEIPVGFLVGNHISLMSLGTMGSAMASAPTIRDGLQALESFTRLNATYVNLELRSFLGRMTLRMHFDVADRILMHHVEGSFMIIQGYIEAVSGRKLDNVSYQFNYPAPRHASEYAQRLHGQTNFDQDENSIEIPSHWLDIRSPYFNPDQWKQSCLQLSQRLRDLGTIQHGIYSQHVLARLRSKEPPLPDLANIAEEMHVSERTLNRRLQSESTSFRHLRGEVLLNSACQHLLETDASIESIAMTLGYQDAANFRRAFRSKFGMTPSGYREQVA